MPHVDDFVILPRFDLVRVMSSLQQLGQIRWSASGPRDLEPEEKGINSLRLLP